MANATMTRIEYRSSRWRTGQMNVQRIGFFIVAQLHGLNLRPVCPQSNALNCSMERPASFTIPPIVNALTGLWRGMVKSRSPLLMTMCLPCLTIRKPTFSRARTASRWLAPENFDTTMPLLRFRAFPDPGLFPSPPPSIHE